VVEEGLGLNCDSNHWRDVFAISACKVHKSPLGVLIAGMWLLDMLWSIRDESSGEGSSRAWSALILPRSSLFSNASLNGSTETEEGCSPENLSPWSVALLEGLEKKLRTNRFVFSHCGRTGPSIGMWERNAAERAAAVFVVRRFVLRRQKGEPLGMGSGSRRWKMTGTWSEMLGVEGNRWRVETHDVNGSPVLIMHRSRRAV